MLIAIVGVALPDCARSEVVDAMDSAGITDPTLSDRGLYGPTLDELREGDDKASLTSFLRSFEQDAKIEPSEEKCVICRDGPTQQLGPLLKPCHVCEVHAHSRCWNMLFGHARQEQKVMEEKEQVNEARCPQCRNHIEEVPFYDPKVRPLMCRLPVGDNEWEVRLPEGEELVVNPWILFMTNTPNQKVSGNILLYRLVAKLGRNYYPMVLRGMREDDRVLTSFGPILHVRSGTGPFWPETWADPALVARVGYSVIRHLYSFSSDENHDWCVNQMMALIGKEKPIWQYCESHCRAWILSDEAQVFARTIQLKMAKRKDEAQRLKWVTQQLSTDMPGATIEWLYWMFRHMVYIQILFFLLLTTLGPLSVLSVYRKPDSAVRWTITLLIWVFLYRLARLCGYLFFVRKPNLSVLNSLAIWKTCSQHINLPPMSPDAILKIHPRWMAACAVEKALEVYGCVIRNVPCVIPNGCGHDLIAGLRIRVLFDRPRDLLSPHLYRYAQKWLGAVKWDKWTWYSPEYLLAKAPSRRRKTMLLEDNGAAWLPKNWPANIFTKAEAYVGKTWDSFKARIIQCRQSGLMLAIGWYFYAAYKCFARTFGSKEGKYIFGPALNALELGETVTRFFSQGVVYEADASNWDGSVTNTMLRIEWLCLSHYFPYKFPYLDQLKPLWFKTIGSSKGIKYVIDWARRSGDFWTTLFNTLLNMICTAFVWTHEFTKVPMAHQVKWRLDECDDYIAGVFAGDDNYFCVRRAREPTSLCEVYENIGLRMEIIRRDNWRDLEFCSGKFYMTERGIKWGLKPFRQLSKFGINFNRHSKRKFKGLLYGNALSMLPIAGHIPVFGVFLRSIVRSAYYQNIKAEDVVREDWQITDSHVDDIHPEEEVEFKRRYGYTDAEYLRLVRWAEEITLDDFPMVLEDELFERGARVDCGVTKLLRTDHKNHASWLKEEPRTNTWGGTLKSKVNSLLSDPVVNVVWPICEDVASHIFGVVAIVFFMCFETLLGSVVAVPGHLFLWLVDYRFGFAARVVAHQAWNLLAICPLNSILVTLEGHLCRDGPPLKVLMGWGLTAGWREPGVFTPMPDCVGSLINRLTGYTKFLFDIGSRWIGILKYRTRKNRKGGSKKVTVVVKPSQQPRKNKKRRSKRGNVVMHPVCLSKVNPFLSAVAGCRSPDDFGYPTGTAVLRTSYNLATDLNGYSATANMAGLRYYRYAPSSTGTTVAWGSGTLSTWPQYSGLANIAQVGRIVSWGLRITTEASITNASGHLWVAHVPEDVAGLWPYLGWPTTEAQWAQLPLAEKYSLVELAERPLIVPGRAFDDGIYRFRDITNEAGGAGYSIESTSGWTSILIFLAGGPASTTMLNVEIIQHIEYIQQGNALYGFIDTLPGIYDEQAMRTCSKVEAVAPVGILETVVDTVEKASAATMGYVSAAARMGRAIAPLMQVAGSYYKKRGWQRSAIPAPYKYEEIEYKE